MTTIAERPGLGELVKAAMAGTANRASITAEALRQSQQHDETDEEKTASAAVTPEHYSTEQIHKLAGALNFIATNVKMASPALSPGHGPGALTVTESAKGGGAPLEPGHSGQAIAKNIVPKTPKTQTEKVQGGKANTGLETNDEMKHAKTAEALEASNLDRITKLAKSDSEGHHVRRALLSNPISSAIEAKKGDKTKAFGEAYVHAQTTGLKHQGVGGAAGAALGAGVGALKGGRQGAAKGALIGGLGGLAAGGISGGIKGNHGAEASKIHGKYAGVDVGALRKLAEDALNPAQISAGKAVPPDASEAGQGVPSEPSDVTSQKSMIASNTAAIDYTKHQAKAQPKREVSSLLSQPALTVAGDNVLQKTLEHTGEAGVKISMAQDSLRVKAARALLSNLMDKVASEEEKKKNGKKKESTMGTAPSSPSASSGFNASTL